LASTGLREHKVKGTSVWVGNFFADVDFQVAHTGDCDSVPAQSKSLNVPPNEPGELLVSAASLPNPLGLAGELDLGKIVQLNSGRPWIRTGVHGHLDHERRFWTPPGTQPPRAAQ
jgi:hypothetical protein